MLSSRLSAAADLSRYAAQNIEVTPSAYVIAMSSLKQALDRIDAWLDSHPTQFAQRLKSQLNPGITRARFHEVVGELPYHLPEEIYEVAGIWD